MAQYKGCTSEADRAVQLTRKREISQKEAELKRKKIREINDVKDIDSKFSSIQEVNDDCSKKSFGLFTLNEIKAKQRELEIARNLAQKTESVLKEKSQKKFKEHSKIHKLSFDMNDEETDETPIFHSDGLPKKKALKNPDVDTSFLKDREREEEENKKIMELKKQWLKEQELIKNETIDITFSYYDGSGHRFSISLKKGSSISDFLQACLQNVLRKEFSELKNATNDQLMYIKEDLILPYHYTFYDFIIKKARGKSGPLFQFDVKDDIRLVNDATVEKEESHAGKVVLRSWYERNKHIFPASRWEPYDPSKNYGEYSVKDKNI